MALRERVMPKVVLTAAAVLVALGVCELCARLVFPAPPVAREPQLAYLYDPELRYVQKPGQQGWIDDGLVTVNSLGFRGPEVALPKPRGRFRVAVIGDSLTLGWGVHDGETYAARLEQELRRRQPAVELDVVNLGVGGYNTRQAVGFLARHVATLAPDLVLLGFYLNDLPDALDDDPAVAGTRIAARNPRPGQVLYLNPTPSGWLERQLRKSRAVYVAGRAYRRLRNQGEWGEAGFAMELDVLAGRSSPRLERAWQHVAVEFERLHELAQSEGFAVGIVLLPPREQVTGQSAGRAYQRGIRELAEPLGFHVIDPLPSMNAAGSGRELFIPYDRNHPSADGHRLIADAIVRYVEEKHLIARAGGQATAAGSAVGGG
jgi:lysophospholipase L1-like esterase